MKKILTFIFAALSTAFLFAEKPIVQDIQSQAGRGTKINVYWTLPQKADKPITKFLLYRNTEQITSYAQLEKLTPITELPPQATGYTDSVSDFKDYYYALVAVTDKPYDLILLSFNSTVNGTHLAIKTETKEPEYIEQEKLYPDGTLRETPLPYVDILDSLNKSSNELSEEAQNSTNSLIKTKAAKTPLLKMYLFEEDLISPDGGDDYLLFEILKNTFVQKKYNEAISDLTKLTGTNINQTTKNRAYFYIGEAEYLLGNYEDAVKTFVKIKDSYPVLADKWMDSALDRIK